VSQTYSYYRHSGALGPLGLLYMTLLGAIGAVVLGAVYGYAIYYIPFIYLNFFITLFFGVGVGLLVGFGGKLGKVRNSGALIVFGLIFGVLAEYAGWISWIHAASEQQYLLTSAEAILGVLGRVAEKGAWSIFGWTPKGAALYAIWAIEAIMIIGGSTISAVGVVSSIPFCERCNKWVEETTTVSPLAPVADPQEMKRQLERGDFTMLGSLEKLDEESAAYTQVALPHCPSCANSYFLTVERVVITKDSKGKEKKEETNLVRNLCITPGDYQMLLGQWQRP
jgi:hypothetical protein